MIVKETDAETGDVASVIVRLRDVARVELGAQFYDQICRLDGEPQQAETGAFWAGEGDRGLFHRPGGNRGHGLVSR